MPGDACRPFPGMRTALARKTEVRQLVCFGLYSPSLGMYIASLITHPQARKSQIRPKRACMCTMLVRWLHKTLV